MKTPLLITLAVAAAAAVAGCAGTNLDGMVAAGSSLAKAATLSDADVKSLSDQACAESDKTNKIAAANSTYAKRLVKVMTGLKNSDVPNVNAKVYMTKDVNAWAMANGCVRVYSGLMDMMNDDEVRGVLGHELGHVALGHTKKAMQVAYTATAARGAAAAATCGEYSGGSSSTVYSRSTRPLGQSTSTRKFR